MNKAIQKSGLVILLILVVAAIIVYWQSTRDDRDSDSLNRQVIEIGTFSKALGNSPFHIALAQDWFAEHVALSDADVRYTEYNDRSSIAAAFNRGDLDLLFSAEIPAILIRAQGENVGVSVVSGYALQEVLVPANSSIQSVQELAGKRVAVQAGTSSHFGLVNILNEAGLSTDDVQLTLMPAAEGRAAFESGNIDAWAVWAPWVETQEVSGRGRVIPGSEARIYSVGTVRSKFADEEPEKFSALIEVIQKSKAWMSANENEAIDIVSGELGFERAVVEQAWPKFVWSAQIDAAATTEWQEKAQFLSDQELTRNNVVVDVRNDLIREPKISN